MNPENLPRRRSLVRKLVACLLLAALPSLAVAQVPPIPITVRVVDGVSGVPVPYAQVSVWDSVGGLWRPFKVGNSKGEVTVQNIPAPCGVKVLAAGATANDPYKNGETDVATWDGNSVVYVRLPRK